jgi:hypothetical protein
MRLNKLLLPLGLVVIIAFNQCALIALGAGVGIATNKVKNPRPSINPNEVDTVWAEEAIEEDVAIVEEAVEAVEAVEEVVEEAVEVVDTTSIEEIEDLPKSDDEKVDRSIFPEDVLGGGDDQSTNTTLKLYKNEVDMGTIEYGDSVKHTFQYQNVGSKDFLLEQYTVGCGCTEISQPKRVLAPGEMGELTVQFNSKKKDGPGEYTSDAMLIGNVAPDGFVEFKMKINVIAKKE